MCEVSSALPQALLAVVVDGPDGASGFQELLAPGLVVIGDRPALGHPPCLQSAYPGFKVFNDPLLFIDDVGPPAQFGLVLADSASLVFNSSGKSDEVLRQGINPSCYHSRVFPN